MFADNRKISAHQISCLLFVDWIGKLLLLLPRVRGTLNGWSYMAAVVLAAIWTMIYLILLTNLSVCIERTFTDFMKKRLGKYPSYTVGLLFLLYLFINLTYLTRLVGRICSVFLLPEIPENVITVLALLAAAMTVGDAQKRARTAELLFLPVVIALAVMLIASVMTVKPENLSVQNHFDAMEILYRSGAAFAGFAGVTLILYEIPYTNWNEKQRMKVLGRGLGITFIFLLAAFLVSQGVLGRESFARLPWPVLTLMSSASLPGDFLQRWDAVFLAFLLFSLFLAAGTSMHYMKRILEEIIPQKRENNVRSLLFLSLLATVLLTGNFGVAEEIYFKWAICGLIPFMVAIPVFLLLLERIKKKCAQ